MRADTRHFVLGERLAYYDYVTLRLYRRKFVCNVCATYSER